MNLMVTVDEFECNITGNPKFGGLGTGFLMDAGGVSVDKETGLIIKGPTSGVQFAFEIVPNSSFHLPWSDKIPLVNIVSNGLFHTPILQMFIGAHWVWFWFGSIYGVCSNISMEYDLVAHCPALPGSFPTGMRTPNGK